jgi:predicted dehydrogenase
VLSKKNINRRQFLKRATTTVAGAIGFPYVIASSALGKAGSVAPSDRITIGHIGVGGQGGGVHVRTFVQFRDVQCVAVCDPFKSKRDKWAKYIDDTYAKNYNRASYKGCDTYNNFEDLLARDDIDGVVIATPDHWHVVIGLAAARAGKDMYIEKPLGLSIEEDKAMRVAINQYGNVFQYGTQQRSSQHCRFGCELVRNGRVGKINTIEVAAPSGRSGGSTEAVSAPDDFDYDRWLGPAPWTPYTHDRCSTWGSWYVYDNSLGFLAGWGAHPLDILDWAYGSDDVVPIEYAGTGTIPTEGLFDTVTNWDVRCKYANGVTMTFKDGPDSTKFISTEGWVKISRGGIDAHPKSLLKSVIGPDEIHLIDSKCQKRNFVDCIKTRAETISPIDSAVRSDTISQLSDIAIRTRRKIKWDPKKEVIIGDQDSVRMLSRPMRSPWHL